MPNVYVLLTRSQTLLSRLIHAFTGDAYTHASIAYDDELRTLCSFARRNPHLPLPAGLVREDLFDGYFERNRYISCALLALKLDAQAHAEMRDAISGMLRRQRTYRYDLKGLLFCKLGIEHRRRGRYFCSMFVAEILQNCGAIDRAMEPSLMKPQDFLGISGFSCIYRGRLSGLMHASRGCLFAQACKQS